MKTSKSIIVVLLFCLSLMACGSRIVSKAEYDTLQVELKKEEDLNQQLEVQYKEMVSQLEEMKGELAKCKSTKKN